MNKTDLSALPQPVREAVEQCDKDIRIDRATTVCAVFHCSADSYRIIRTELLRVTGECERRHRMCIDRSQELLRLVRESGELQERAERAESELAALRKRIADAPVAEITREDWLENFRTFSADFIGKRVALLTVTDEDKA